ncbi:carboxypeptidase-like regulatory domain-containing protein [Rugamonas apoptosis]|uniref:Carboxypeptidase regulatory-like domain-containing protein n=1 Tax=Rugamonas apoptosis TaxID=2758570 RepID=A0A7W2F9T7_9BURK|nr:carboxypeptidase-like regulatory domain-containing protein [Rugamonas apoptosis]MBA5687717.1 carboxypeptidase regulatory-like domain-containing protein [Rugamonas apoptosis]
MKSVMHRAAIAGALGLAAAGSVSASVSLPPVQNTGQVAYLSGGIGQDEAAALQAESRRWPLTLEFAVANKHRSEFAADVAVSVRDAKGREVLNTTSDGPFLLAKLKPGSYTVEASLAGKTMQRRIVVSAQHPNRVLLLWPSTVDRGIS